MNMEFETVLLAGAGKLTKPIFQTRSKFTLLIGELESTAGNRGRRLPHPPFPKFGMAPR